MRQLLYISTNAVPGDRGDLAGILEQSRHNNALEGVTGILWSDGTRFLQVLEGSDESVGATYARIARDGRHRDLELLDDRTVAAREFGSWSMLHRRAGEAADAHDAQMRRLLANASAQVRECFETLIAGGDPD